MCKKRQGRGGLAWDRFSLQSLKRDFTTTTAKKIHNLCLEIKVLQKSAHLTVLLHFING